MKTNEIYEMDCIKGMKEVIEPNSVDIIITSPPYNIGIKYNSHKDNMPFEQYLNWMEEFGKECSIVLKENGSLFFNIGDKASDELKSFEVAKRIAKSLKLQNTIHWVKSIAIPEHNVNIGHYKPINSTRFLNNLHEYIFHFTKTKKVKLNRTAVGVPYADKSNIKRWKHGKSNGDKRDRGNVWYITYDTIQSGREHPAMFPKKLPEMCIKLHGFNKDTVILDPFLGAGTTCIVAKELGCKYLGFEIDKKYRKMALNKLSQTSLK
ncbi:Modification methylase MjaV [Candidatus Tiddalikarchaeum anstoanum]|nr:Modification methylase MjaV [Candidatus Tiddalikarchaeum anstoanum]